MPTSRPVPQQRRERILVTVRTYPTPSQKDIEVSCTAGVTSGGKLIRLFPIPYRFMDGAKRFHKYQEIEGLIWKSSDARPESHKIAPDSIQVLGPPLGARNRWAARWERIKGTQVCCMCCLQNQQAVMGTSSSTLGFLIPEAIEGLVLEPTPSEWSPREVAKLSQASLWQPEQIKMLEKLPYRFKYRYRCPHSQCPTHLQSCTDWEIGESFRKWRRQYGPDWESQFRQTYEHRMIEERETGFFVGTVHRHPTSWLIVGLWYPPKGPRQATLSLESLPG